MDPNLISQLQEITACTKEQAEFHLEAAGGILEQAIVSILDDSSHPEETSSSPQPTQTPSQSNKPIPQPIALARGITGFSDLNKPNSNPSDQANQYFAGGEKSGIAVQGRGKQTDPQDVIKAIMEKAEKQTPLENDSQPPPLFSGLGNRLGDETVSTPPSTSTNPPTTVRETVERTLTFWQNGFSIDDSPLFSYEDPMNKKYLEAIQSGHAPTELLNVKYGQDVQVKVSQRIEEDYKPPAKKPVSAFSGQGNSLSGPSTSQTTNIPGAFPSQAPSIQPVQSTPYISSLDETQPQTTLQIRLIDGTRLIAKFNQTQTVSDIRRFVAHSRPGQGPFDLMTSFPVKKLDDDSVTIAGANLLNAVIIQKSK